MYYYCTGLITQRNIQLGKLSTSKLRSKHNYKCDHLIQCKVYDQSSCFNYSAYTNLIWVLPKHQTVDIDARNILVDKVCDSQHAAATVITSKRK